MITQRIGKYEKYRAYPRSLLATLDDVYCEDELLYIEVRATRAGLCVPEHIVLQSTYLL